MQHSCEGQKISKEKAGPIIGLAFSFVDRGG
jgi:hypothetical protein